MQFSIIRKNLLAIECKRVIKHIKEQGGEFMGFDPEDSKYINLASDKYKPPSDQIVFEIKYVKKCINANRLLNLDAFQISGKKLSDSGCMSLHELLEIENCEHLYTAEKILEMIEKL
ncbi:uncharacterized protein LOC131666399 isoform X2 [Phymastichus coffea]|nr:uncharacterized protein LOC131666399 isoform X2 [Phymastichus coffea]